MFDLTGKNILLTGASGGIGRDIARALYKAGAQLVLAGTRVDALVQLKNELGERAFVVAANLAEDEGAGQLVTSAEEALSAGIDVLINNAGITRDSLALRMKDEDWDAVMNVNLRAAFQLSRACLKGMMKRRTGRIINISSVVGAIGNPGQANYAAAKAGMIGMSKALAQEVAARGITVNCVAPGFIVTPMTDGLTEEQKQNLMVNIPAGRLGAGDDVAAAVLYLASDEASYVTGQTLHVNGGLAMI